MKTETDGAGAESNWNSSLANASPPFFSYFSPKKKNKIKMRGVFIEMLKR